MLDIESDICPCCSGKLHSVGENVAERLDIVPAQFRVLELRRPKDACPSCDDVVVQAPAWPGSPRAGFRPRRQSPGCWSRNVPIICRYIVRPRPMRARAWRSIARRWPVGSGAAFLLRLAHARMLAVLKASPKLFAD